MTKTLMGLEFDQLIGEAYSQTQTGSEILSKYKAHLMDHPVTCGLVNQFIREARQHVYDNGIHAVLSQVSDYITTNKVSWALATACENINNGTRNYLDVNAAKQVSKLLEMDEHNVVKYIRSGALKNVMFCEAFRSIAKQVFKDQPIVEANAEYTAVHPISFVENVGDGLCFEVRGKIFKIDEDKHIQETNYDEVSNVFATITRALESSNCLVSEDNISMTVSGTEYVIEGYDKICRKPRTESQKEVHLTVEQMREQSRLVVATMTPRLRTSIAEQLEAIALISENYNNIASLDNTTIYTTSNDEFVVIESGADMYASLISSRRHPKWTINESAIDAISFIKTKTNVSLAERYQDNVKEALQQASESKAQEIQEQLEQDQNKSLKERIALLTEKFKNDPVKLAILSQQAAELASLEQ